MIRSRARLRNALARLALVKLFRHTGKTPDQRRTSERRSICLASPGIPAPIIDAADDHVSRIERQCSASRRQRRAGIAQYANLIARTRDCLRLGQLDPAVAAAGA